MFRIVALALLFGLVLSGFAQTGAEKTAEVDRTQTEWVANALRSMQTIKIGMTRADLLEVFTTEGGLSSAAQHTYVYRGCRIIKVDVTFDVPPGAGESPTDRIVRISRPYLEWAHYD